MMTKALVAVAAAIMLIFGPVIASAAASDDDVDDDFTVPVQVDERDTPSILPIAWEYGSPTNRPLTLAFELRGDFDEGASYVVSLQRKPKGGEWEETDVAGQASIGTFTLTVPPLSKSKTAKNTTVRYRAVIADSPTTVGYVSGELQVSYQNTAKYTGLKLVTIRAVSKYCRSAVIRVEHLGGGVSGLYGAAQPNILFIDPSMKSRSTQFTRSVVMHECGHYLQNEYGIRNGLSDEQLRKRVKKIFGTNHPSAYEHMADCIANAVYPQHSLGYGGTCSARQMKVTKRFLRDGTL